MGDRTSIQWTDATWSPVLGCSPVSVGCAHCYAVRTTWRLAHNPNSTIARPRHDLVEYSAGKLRWTGEVVTLPDQLEVPRHWRKPRRIFVCNQADLFHPDVPDEFIVRVFVAMASAPQHVYQVLTKRPERMRKFFSRCGMWEGFVTHDGTRPTGYGGTGICLGGDDNWPPKNWWLGVSVEDQRAADERIPTLLQTPAAVRFVSCEPLIAPVNLLHPMWMLGPPTQAHGMHQGLDWVIIGGESGPGVRPCDVAWIRSLVEQCRATGTPCFVKQLGTAPRGTCSWTHHAQYPPEWLDEDGVLPSVSGRPAHDLCHAYEDSWWPCAPKLRDRKGADVAEWPEDLRVRQMPEVSGV